MKKYSLILFICTLQVISQDYWVRVPSPTTKWLVDSYLLDSLYGWASGDSGTILHTSNGGNNWILQNSGITAFNVEKIFFIDRNNGWAIVNDFLFFGTIILRTSNSGSTWQSSRFFDSSQVINTIYFHDINTGYVSGFTGRIYKTTNSGNNWIECFVDTNYCPFLYLFPKYKFNFLNTTTGYVCGGQRDIQGMVWKTTNSGVNWFTYCLTAEPLFDIRPFSNGWIVSAGGDPEYGLGLAQSADFGVNWEPISLGFSGIGYSLAYRTPSEVWIPMGFGKIFAVSTDSGNGNRPWKIVQTPDSISVYSAGFPSPQHGWAFGDKGEILKYNKNIIGISSNQNIMPVENKLGQNYPNPFNPVTTIKYSISKAGFVKFNVFDITGKEVYSSAEGYKPIGQHSFKFFIKNLSSGVYFYKISAVDYSESKKMVILK